MTGQFLYICARMKKICLLIAAVALGLGAAQNASAKSRVETDSLASAVLGSEVKFNVYLPDGYDNAKHYPVIYLLHGLTDTYSAWIEKGRANMVADQLIASGECVPCVIVMPNAGGTPSATTWNGYFNMPGWNYEDFFFQEFLPFVEKKYNAGGTKGNRAVMGLSMGGGGSVAYCQKHPDMFSSCYAMSAWLDNKDTGVKHHEGKRDCLYYVCKAVCDNSSLAFAANASPETIKALKGVKWFLDIGDDDFLLDLSFELFKLYKSAGVKCELRVRDGVHNWEYWHNALHTAFPFASRNFSR